MAWWNRTEEELELMKAPLTRSSGFMPWNQDANIAYNINRAASEKQPAMADLREAAQSEYTDGSRYGIRPEGYEKYGDMDWLGGRKTRPTWTEEDQVKINEIEAEQNWYNQSMGDSYSGGPLAEPQEFSYPNGGRFLPYVGNSWWQTSEPILPWNRKDWRQPGNRWYSTGK